MANITIRIRNLAEIRAAFGKAPRLTVTALNKAIQKSIFSIERDSKINSPVDTGFLRASHRSVFSNLRGEVSPEAEYAIYVHEGTRYMRRRPFLLEAVKTNEKKVQGFFESEIQGVLDQIARSTR